MAKESESEWIQLEQLTRLSSYLSDPYTVPKFEVVLDLNFKFFAAIWQRWDVRLKMKLDLRFAALPAG